VHEGQLSGLIELQTSDASAVREHRGLGELAKLLSVHESLQNVLLHVQIAVDDAIQSLPQGGKILYRLAQAVIGGNVIGCRFRCAGGNDRGRIA